MAWPAGVSLPGPRRPLWLILFLSELPRQNTAVLCHRQVRKSLSVLWVSEGWDGVVAVRREEATAGSLAEAFRAASSLGETDAGVAADRDPTPSTDVVIR